MSDYPFKVGDLVHVKASHVIDRKPGVIVSINEDTGFFDILINNTIEKVHKNYIVTPKIKAVKMIGGLK